MQMDGRGPGGREFQGIQFGNSDNAMPAAWGLVSNAT